MIRALVCGLGSIGSRHARVLAGMGCDVAVVSRRPAEGYRRFAAMAEALAAFHPEYVIIATETSAHMAGLAELARLGFDGMVLVEKPLGIVPGALPAHNFRRAAVAYNLRFNPVLEALAEALAGETVLSCQVYCGQYLPTWRPGTDYRQSYSARSDLGGGVLRDLSHEIDYLLWLFGPWRRMAALGGKVGDLEIDSDDCWGLLLELERCPLATMQVNYLDRPGRREIVVNTASHTFHADLMRGVLSRDGGETHYSCGRDDTYLAQHRAILAGGEGRSCTLEQGEAVMRFIAGAERAAKSGMWVCGP